MVRNISFYLNLLRSRTKPFPNRKLFGPKELRAVKKVFHHYWKKGVDFGFQGKFEKEFINKFCDFQSENGYADAVSSGTAALYVALKAIDIKKNDEVVVSPITSPGGVTPIVELGAKIAIADSQSGSHLVDLKTIKNSISPNCKAVVINHSGGYPVHDLDKIANFLSENSIMLVEDCSQAHGAYYKNKKVGNFGDIAIFSTMFTKTIATGGAGGVTYTKSLELYNLMRSISDRGKPFHLKYYDPKASNKYLFPSLNFNSNEISCAIGSSVMDKVDSIVKKRTKIMDEIIEKLKEFKFIEVFKPIPNTKPSPFFIPIVFHPNKTKISKINFTKALQNEGIPLNPHYSEVVYEWGWMKPFFAGNSYSKNAVDFRNSSFNLLLNENYKTKHIDYIVSSIRNAANV